MRIAGDVLHHALMEAAVLDAVEHAAQHAGGVLDRFAPAQLNVVGIEKHHAGAQFADAGLKRHACARGGLGKNEGPSLACERLRRVRATLAFEGGGVVQDFFKIRRRQLFQ